MTAYRTAVRSASRVRAGTQAQAVAGPSRTALRRPASTVAEQAQQHQSHIAAGAGGGLLVVLLGYSWYHFSGTKEVVGSARQLQAQLKSVKDGAANSMPDAQSILKMTRQAAQSAAAAIPGAGFLVDRLFDQADEIAKEHGPEVEKALRKTYTEVTEALKSGEKGGEKVLQIVVSNLRQLQSFASDQITPVLESNPKLKAALEEPLKQLRELGDKHGDEAQQLYRDLAQDLSKLTSRGMTSSTLADASSLVQKRLAQAQKLAQNAGEDAWRRAQSEAGPFMDKLPDLSKSFGKQLDSLKDTIGPEGNETVEKAYKQLREIATSKGSAKETLAKAQKVVDETLAKLREVAQNKSGDLQAKGAEALKALPGMDRFPELGELSKLLQQRGPEAEKLLRQTVDDVRKVLRQRLDEGKKLGEVTAQEAKKRS